MVRLSFYVGLFRTRLTVSPRFKLHLRPRTGGKQLLDGEIPLLPPKKTVVEVFADFLRYLLKCTAQFIQESHLNGKELWASTKNDLYFVLPHPNGWGGREQSLMRRASILAGLIPNSPSGNARVSFVTEGEASLHFAIQHNILSGHMKVLILLPSSYLSNLTLMTRNRESSLSTQVEGRST